MIDTSPATSARPRLERRPGAITDGEKKPSVPALAKPQPTPRSPGKSIQAPAETIVVPWKALKKLLTPLDAATTSLIASGDTVAACTEPGRITVRSATIKQNFLS